MFDNLANICDNVLGLNKQKTCSKCKTPKALTEFNKDRQKADGLCCWCRGCRSADKATYYQNNSEAIRGKVSAWRRANPGRKVACYRNSRYSLAPDRFQTMFDTQGGKCAVCKLPFTDKVVPNVDHDHRCCKVGSMVCGKCVRGLLCHRCNKALGYLKDSIEFLQNAISYLQGANVERT